MPGRVPWALYGWLRGSTPVQSSARVGEGGTLGFLRVVTGPTPVESSARVGRVSWALYG